MSKENNWVPMDKGLAQYLPTDREYTRLEAMFSHTKDIDENREYSIAGYAKLWSWSRSKVRKFLSEVHSIKGHIEDTKRTQERHPIHFIDKGLWDKKNTKRTQKRQMKDTTINPNKNIYSENDEKINENAKSVIELFNKIAGKNCLPVEANLKPIRGRIREGITGKQFAFVIKNKTLQWKNTDMEKYLHPTTLFGSKFDKYVNENPARDKNPDWVPI